MFDHIRSFLDASGYLGIALLMFLENVFPPIPSELIMPLAGFTAARGELNLALAIIAGSIGSLAGATAWYYAGRWLGCARLRRAASRHGSWLTVDPGDVDDARDWFVRHSGKSVLFGRLVPAVRTLISVPAGIAEMSLVPFLAYSLAGTFVWSSALATAGYLLESQYDAVSAWLNPVANIIIAALAIWYVYRVATYRPAAH